jgi:saxitoxin biosynthesis operon SxtJ-like protein
MSAHEDLSRAHEIKGASDRTFGFTFAVFFALVGLWPLLHHRPLKLWALALSLVFLAITLVKASLLRPMNSVWIWIGAMLNRVVSPVMSGIVFYVAVTPMAVIMRMNGKDPLRLRWDPNAASYWILRDPPGPEPASMADQF